MAGLSWIVQTAALILLFSSFAAASSMAGRTLLQQIKDCPISFEMMNYTDLISKCKGPDYPVAVCCDALAEFACPHADYINDLSTNCATMMFSYINLNGRYPPGLFANQCVADKDGLNCPVIPSGVANKSSSNDGHRNRSPCSIAVFATIVVSALGFFLF